MESITRNLANEYLRAAHLVAGTRTEQLALKLAADLNNIGTSKPTFEIFAAAELKPKEPDMLEVLTWQALILKEIHAAICRRDNKYKQEVAALKQNGNLLIGAIGGYVAAKLGVATAVIAALVAAILRIVVVMGVTVFCKKFNAAFS